MNLSTTGLRLAADAAIDLHLHTTYSDGRWSPESLLDYVIREQFDLVAIADHDRVDTVRAVQQLAVDKRFPVLVAVEITTSWNGEWTDLLCYGFDPDNNALSDLAQDLLRRQQENTREVYTNLHRQGCTLPPGTLPALLAEPSAQQPHAILAFLKAHDGGIDDPSARKLLREAGITFATSEMATVVEAAHQSSAVCVLAHPGRGEGSTVFDVPVLDKLRRETPIDGLEVYYPSHTPAMTAMYLEYARRHQMLVSAGSDSHSLEQPPIKYRAELSRDLLERVGIQVG